MYALIALGFVLVYKATDAVNFAQGEFVMIAGLVVAAALGIYGAPLWLSIALGIGAMVGFGFALERTTLRKLIGRPIIAPPNMPADRLKVLRDAYARMTSDADFLAEAKKRDWEVEYISGQELEAMAKKAIVQSPETVERLKKLLGG